MEGSRNKIIKNNFRFLLIFSLVIASILQIAAFLVYMNLSFTLNPNFIFGLVQGNVLAIITSMIILLLMLIFSNKFLNLGLVMVVAGLISNVADRFFYGGIIDYFKIWIIPTFNLADVLIIIGIILIVPKIIRTT